MTIDNTTVMGFYTVNDVHIKQITEHALRYFSGNGEDA